MKLKALATKFTTALNPIYGEDEAQALFLITLNHFLNFNRADYLFRKEQEIDPNDLLKLENTLAELQSGKPIQYILGETAFFGLKFKVNPAVLIPRPETEELVEWIIDNAKSWELGVRSLETITQNSKLKTVLDIGTGSGCIAISIKKNLPNTVVTALDISEESLKVAKENAILNNVEVAFIHQDILAIQNSQPATHNPPQYSLIVSNPPYIKEDEKLAMHQNVLANEPHSALFVSNENPLVFYAAIADFALENLETNGLLFFEINEYLGQQTIELLKHKGFKDIELRKDMQGKDRMVCCHL